MTIMQQVRQRAQALTLRDALDWLIGLVPFVLGFIVGRIMRVVKIAVAAFAVGYQRGSRIE